MAETNDKQTPPTLWGLYHDEKGWSKECRGSLNKVALWRDAYTVTYAGYRPVTLVSLEAVLGMLRERLERHRESTSGLAGAIYAECESIIQELEAMGAPNA